MDTLQKLILFRKLKASGGSVSWETISGTLPLTLLNAAAKPIRSLKQFGKVVQNGTPTPESPVDIVCNNGAVKWDSTNQRIYADGTPETLTVGGVDNFLSRDGETAGRIIGSDGVITKNSNYSVSEPFQLSALHLHMERWLRGETFRDLGVRCGREC